MSRIATATHQIRAKQSPNVVKAMRHLVTKEPSQHPPIWDRPMYCSCVCSQRRCIRNLPALPQWQMVLMFWWEKRGSFKSSYDLKCFALVGKIYFISGLMKAFIPRSEENGRKASHLDGRRKVKSEEKVLIEGKSLYERRPRGFKKRFHTIFVWCK